MCNWVQTLHCIVVDIKTLKNMNSFCIYPYHYQHHTAVAGSKQILRTSQCTQNELNNMSCLCLPFSYFIHIKFFCLIEQDVVHLL